jgi:sec-independent protein translocase protein TatA
MPPVGPTELILILAILIVIFGAGRLSEIGGAVGRSIREFRRATEEDRGVITGAERSNGPRACRRCGVALHGGARFCGSCGTAVAAEDIGGSLVSADTPTPLVGRHDAQ